MNWTGRDLEQRRVAIVGGGAAGLTAAIAAAGEGAQVVVCEANDRVGKSILATGNGRCNLTNAHLGAASYNDPDFVSPVLSWYTPNAIRLFFGGLGLLTKVEDAGRAYPFSHTAGAVLDVLRFACERLGVELRCGCRVDAVVPGAVESGDGSAQPGFDLVLNGDHGDALHAGAVVVACGGGVDLLSGMGHATVPFRPALCSLATDTRPLRGLDGVRARASVSAYHDGERMPFVREDGEVLFRKYGVSGIVVFDLSRFVGPGDWLAIDFVPQMSADGLGEWLGGSLGQMQQAAFDRGTCPPTVGELLAGTLHPRIVRAVVRSVGLSADDAADVLDIPRLAHACKDFRLQVEGLGDTAHAQITRGGAATGQFDAVTLESRLHAGLYAAGETLDVDGPCGGFNLHWAWASGLTAGENAARVR